MTSTVVIPGRITVNNSDEMRRKLLAALRSRPARLTVDLSQATYMDSSGLATLLEAVRIARKQGTRLLLAGVSGQPDAFSKSADRSSVRICRRGDERVNVLEDIGDSVIQRLAYVGQLSMQFWSGVLTIPRALPLVGKRGRWLAAIRQMAAIGVDALPMIATVSMSAGSIFAMQSGNELRRFGALSLVINIIAIGFAREIGPLLTAIVVSSRSGSAFSAEIGAMVVTNEIDVLRTMGLSPIEFVLAPKS